jgi:hypothetical protein
MTDYKLYNTTLKNHYLRRKITYKDISRMGYEFNELFIKKYRENKKNKLNDESKLMEQ